MPLRPALLLRPLALCGLALFATATQAATPPRDALEPGDRIIVKLRDGASEMDGTKVDLSIRRLRTDTGVTMNRLHTIPNGVHLLGLDRTRSAAELNSLLATLRRNPQVEFAEPNGRVHAHAYTPNDPLYVNQWYLQNSNIAGIRANAAWDITKGGTSPATSPVIIAVIDTGVRFDHPDLRRAASGGKLLPGYDFVSGESSGTYATANDGDGWDADPSDPGDWISATDLASATFKDGKCGGGPNQDMPTSSSWHGTRVAGMIAADTDNASGIAGAAFNVRILPVRALGKCGGRDFDVLAAMYWSAGLTIPAPLVSPGAPLTNPTPAQIINLSLGSAGSCSQLYAQAVKDITAHGVLIVASAGNEGGPVDEPANCAGVLGVGGLRHAGTKVGYSNLGPEVGLSAPAGNCVNTTPGSPCLFTLDTTTDSGTQGPVGPTYTNQYNSNVGTSFSSPLAAAAAGLMHAVNPQLTPVQLIARLKATALPFPTQSENAGISSCQVPTATSAKQDSECICDTSVCGAGMLNMGAAVNEALRPSAVAGYSGTVGPNRTLTLDGSASGAAQGRTISSFAWSVVSTSGGAATPVFANASLASTSVVSPSLGSYTLRLTVTDSEGATDTADITVDAASSGGTVTPSTPPATSGSGGGGGLGVELVALTALAAATITRRRRSARGIARRRA